MHGPGLHRARPAHGRHAERPPAPRPARARVAQARPSRLRERGATAAATPACEPDSPIHLSSLPRSAAFCQRSSGSLARHFFTTRSSAGGDMGCTDEIGGGSADMIAVISDAWLAAGKRLPSRRHLVQHRAERKDVRPPVGFLALELLGRHVLERPEDRALLRSSACCVGSAVRLDGFADGAIALARPKSSSFTPDFVIITLPGFRSRCTIPCRCALSSASAISTPYRSVCSSGSAPLARRSLRASRLRAAP